MYDILDNLIIKFGDKKWIDKLVSGEIFMQPLKFYRDLEEKEMKKGQGDKYEGILRTALESSYFYSKDNKKNDKFIKRLNDIMDNAIDLKFEFKYKNDEKYLVSCFYKVNPERFEFTKEENGQKHYKYNFTDDEKVTFGKWGDSALIINSEVFFKAITYHLSNTDSKGKKVEYYDGNNTPMNMIINFQEKDIGRLFWKENYFLSQNEYRFIIAEQSEEGKVVTNIGEISEISMQCNSNELLEYGFTYRI